MQKNAEFWIEKLGLKTHPEGGYFKETYRSDEQIDKSALPSRYTGSRSFGTSVYFLIQDEDPSRFHRLQSDEVWHFYAGSPMTLYIITPDGELETKTLGPDPDKGHEFQAVVYKYCWFGALVEDKNGFSLVGCNIAPGFDFDDFELGEKAELKKQFPNQAEIIEKLS